MEEPTNISKLAGLVEVPSNRMKVDRISERNSLGEVERPISNVELLRIMECPVCSEFPAPPIFSCEKGHFICNSCMKILANCSLCEAAFTGVRNFALESIIESSKFKCRNAYLGCPSVVTGAELNSHVANCIFRPLQCEEQDCIKLPLSPKEYFQHMVKDHAVPGCYKRLTCGKAEMVLKQSEDAGDYPSDPSFFIKLSAGTGTNIKDGPTFVIMTKRYRTFMCWWCACLEPEAIKKFGVILSLENNIILEDRQSIRWNLPLQPIWKTFDEIRDTGLCAVLPNTHLLPFYSDGKSWDLKVEIIKKKGSKDKRRRNRLQHYYPLLILMIIGIFAVFLSMFIEYGLNWFDSLRQVVKFNGSVFWGDDNNPSSQTDFHDKYIGYRGFYYKTE